MLRRRLCQDSRKFNSYLNISSFSARPNVEHSSDVRNGFQGPLFRPSQRRSTCRPGFAVSARQETIMSPRSRTTSTRLHAIVAAVVASVSSVRAWRLACQQPGRHRHRAWHGAGFERADSAWRRRHGDVDRARPDADDGHERGGRVRVYVSASRDLSGQRLPGRLQGPGAGQRRPAAGPASACRFRRSRLGR